MKGLINEVGHGQFGRKIISITDADPQGFKKWEHFLSPQLLYCESGL